MRKNLLLIVTVAVFTTASFASTPTALGQGFFDDLVNELDNLINNAASNPPATSPPPANSRPSAAGTVLVEANSGWESEVYPRGTYATIGGQRWNLPAAVQVDANGNVSAMPANARPAGNQIRVSNSSANDFYFGVTIPSSNNPPPATSQGPSRTNNRQSVGNSNVEVRNRSGRTVRVHYTLPQGRTYGPNGWTTVWDDVAHGQSDKRVIAARTKVTVDGYNTTIDGDPAVFYVGGDMYTFLSIEIDGTGISGGLAAASAPTPGPSPSSLPNQVAVINAGTSWQSGAFPAGTRAKVGGAGVNTETTYKLPASVVAFADGGLGELSSVLNGTYLVIKNNSSTDVIVEFLTPASRPGPSIPSPPSNQANGNTGNIQVRNQSGQSITARYALPRGKKYAYGGSLHSSLFAKLDDGDSDITPNIAAGTRVTVDGYPGKEFFVRRGDDLNITVFADDIGVSAASGSPNPSPSPSPPRLSNPTADAPAAPAPAPMPSSPMPDNITTTNIPPPAPSPGTPTPNPMPENRKPRTTPLTSKVAQDLVQQTNAEIKQLLTAFEQASEARLGVLDSELVAAGVSQDEAESIVIAVANYEVAEVSELFERHGPRDAKVRKELEAVSIDIARFRGPFLDLCSKVHAGLPIKSMAPNFEAIKSQNHKSSGLADAMRLIQQELVIRDQISSAAVSSVVDTGSQSLPSGNVTIIRHHSINGDAVYVGNGGLLLTQATDNNILVVQATAGASASVNNQFTIKRPSIASLQQAAGSRLFIFDDQPAPAAPTEDSGLLDLLKAVQ